MSNPTPKAQGSLARNKLHATMLLLPLALSQLILQGGDRLAVPYLQRLVVQANVYPDAAEVEYLTVLFGIIIFCELTLLIPSVIWWTAFGAVTFSGAIASTHDLVKHGLRVGVPYALLVCFLMWWTQSTPDNLRYVGIVGHRVPYYLAVACLLGSFGALCEELYFRRVLLTGMMSSLPTFAAVTLNVLLFAAWHPHAYGNPGHMIAILAGGTYYSVLLIRYNSVIPSIICHALVNVFSVLLANVEP